MAIFLETKRLVLKTAEPDELQHWILLRQDPDVMKYIGTIKSTAEIEKFYWEAVIPYHNKHKIGFCSVFEKDTGALIGQAGLFHPHYNDSNPDIEVAYRFLKAFWGKGYATEAAIALIEYGFAHLSIQKLVGFTTEDNIGSNKVLQKAGMHLVGKKINETNLEILVYEITKP